MKSKHLFFTVLMALFAVVVQAQTITGTVSDENGMPLPGATVLVTGTSNGVSTDFDGNFSIEANVGDNLTISFVGYASQSVAVTSMSAININLEPDNSLDEVIVTSLGVKRNVKALGYSVTQVEGSEVSANKTTNAINSLQGKIAGVQITGNAAGAKGSTRVIIRGNSSLTGNNQPLYVIDGITINNSNLGSAGVWGGADSGDGISALNPDEVESISVLKGGAAAALYGSRASNGVIIITTKSGAGVGEGMSVEVSSSAQFDDIRNDPYDPQTTYGQGRDYSTTSDNIDTYANWGPRMNGASVEQWDGVSRPYSYKGNNLRKFYSTGETYINTVAVNSTSKNSNTRFSFTNLSNKDIIPNSTLKRNSLGLNTTQKYKKLTATLNLKYVNDDAIGAPRLSDSPGNANFGIRLFAPSIDVNDMLGEGGLGTNADGTEFRTSDNTYSQNPWFAAYQYFDNSVKERFIGSADVRFDLDDTFYLRGRFGVDRYDYHRTSGTPYGTAYQPLGSMSEYKLTNNQHDADLFLGMNNFQIIDDLSVTAFVGIGQNYQRGQSVSASGSNFIVPFLYNVANTQNQGNGYGFSEKQINSAYGSAEFGFRDAMFLTLTARNDWFSTLSLPNKETPNNDLFTSASLSIVLSDLMTLPSIVSFAKLRAGYSQVAGGADSPYQLNLTYGIYGQGHQNASLGTISNGSIPNPDITPFEKDETEVGLDLRLFDNKVSLDLTYYSNETNGDIVGVSASPTSGYGSALANLGVVTNEGIEALINFSPIRNDDFAWDLTLNYSNNESTIVSTNDSGGNISMEEPRSRNLNVTHIVGEQYGALFGTSYVRDAQGRIVHDIESDGTPIPQIGPRKILGFGVAPTSIGITNSFRFKNYNFSFLIEGKSGGQVYSGTNAMSKYFGAHKATIDADGRENGFTVSGVDANGNAFTTSIAPNRIEDYWRRTYSIAEESIYDSDYLRLRQMSIGYTIPDAALEGTHIESATVSLIGRNLFFLSNSVENVDPESGYNVGNSQGLEWFGMPVPRSLGINVNLKF
ncbi:MAG: SusC/RagA family TonB-linked outer membrane protein [Flavobacteriia bacterium]|nr:SusC/RagA family TonB-linked outer membrane protein [Flavobacteriia bacterium]